MDSIVEVFQKEEIDGKPYFVHNLDGFGEQTMFLCPYARRIQSVNHYYVQNGRNWDGLTPLKIVCSPYYDGVIEEKDYYSVDYYERLDSDNHPILPLFWCNSKKDDYNDVPTTPSYYFCIKCDSKYHKESVMAPLEIKPHCHPAHPLKLSYICYPSCAQCGEDGSLVYHCKQCNLSMHPLCALKAIPLSIDKPKRHDHPLTLFTRKACLDCNVCGLIKQMHSTYVCLKCNFVAHQDCADFPSIIRISRHYHRISFTYCLRPGKWSCGVCRKKVDNEYSAYACKKCDGYVVHSRCAMRKDIWDGKELENVPEEDDFEEVVNPFERISDGIIHHFSHDHYLKLETISGEVYDENKICHACVSPIYEDDFYSCMECDFILHDTCANAPRRMRHHLHPHPLTLKITCENDIVNYFNCHACGRLSCGFVYESGTKENLMQLDMKCASIFEPLDYQGHEHPLFLALDQREKKSCQFCFSGNTTLINCIECDFIRCLRCITLPYMARYKHDKHFLELNCWEDANEPDWCQICETLIFSEKKKERRFYRCKQCCTTLHLKCFFGEHPYLKPGGTLKTQRKTFQILPNNSLSRPICHHCHNRCKDKLIYKEYDNTYCSIVHVFGGSISEDSMEFKNNLLFFFNFVFFFFVIFFSLLFFTVVCLFC